ncbi:MAG: CoA pyrophosphatase [Novosphingobium sp.]
MSAIHDRLLRHYRASHETTPPELFHDWSAVGMTGFRPAAVLIAFTEQPEPGILLLHRPSNMRAHPGQVAFPGGKIDGNETPVEAALREANEELGIDPDLVRVIGTSDLYRTHSGYEITPVLATVPAGIAIQPNPTEVAQWFKAPAAFVLDPANQMERWVEWEKGTRPYYEILWQDHNIWGVTAALIVNLARRLQWHD